ncbi:MAG: SigE family RNA polymerase sigma factor [Propionibacteriaceae bacterium]|nr:SigE family RNA polymerase sigma factor [Propionibacteriaceae bacterium]
MDRKQVDAEFDAFVRRAYQRLCHAGYLLSGDWHKAEDATQEALLRVHAKWARIQDPEPYARRSLMRLLVDESRRPWRREAPQDEIRLESPTDPQTQIDDRDELSRALGHLTARRRACLVWRYFLDASVAETAAALGCSEGNVKKLTSDAIAALRGILTDQKIEELA